MTDRKTLLEKALGASTEEITVTILNSLIEDNRENPVIDSQTVGNNRIEVWFHRGFSGLTGKELTDLQQIFDIHEISIYGDVNMVGHSSDSGFEGTFHMIVSPA